MKSGGVFLENGSQSAEDAALEARANDIVDRILHDTQRRSRRILSLQELCAMQAPRAAFERFFPEIHAYFYGIDGELDGKRVSGAMLAGNCMLIFAASRHAADELAQGGLEETIRLAKDYAWREHLGCPPAADEGFENAGVETMAGARH